MIQNMPNIESEEKLIVLLIATFKIFFFRLDGKSFQWNNNIKNLKVSFEVFIYFIEQISKNLSE